MAEKACDGEPCTTPGCDGIRPLVPHHEVHGEGPTWVKGAIVGYQPAHSRFCPVCIGRLARAPFELVQRSWTAAGPDAQEHVFDEMARWLEQDRAASSRK